MRACLWLVILAACSAMATAAETTNLVEILRRFQAELDLHGGRTPSAGRVDIPADTQTAMKPEEMAAPREYRLRAGDWVRVQIENEPGMSTDRTEVAQDGTMRLPIVGSVRVAGTTVAEATQAVRQLLERDYLVDPVVAIERLSAGPNREAAPEIGNPPPKVAAASPAEREASAPVASPSDSSNLVDPTPRKRAEAVPSPSLPPAAAKVEPLEPPPAPPDNSPTDQSRTSVLVDTTTPPEPAAASTTPPDKAVLPDSPTIVTATEPFEQPTAPREAESTEQTDTPAMGEVTGPLQSEAASTTPPDETVLPDSPATVTAVEPFASPTDPIAAVSTEQDPDPAEVESGAPATTGEDPAESTLYLVLTNQVAKPGKYPWTGEGMTLRIALETAGGPTAQADMGRVLVRRLIRGEPRQLEVNLEHPGEAWRSGALLLKPGDVVEVPVRK